MTTRIGIIDFNPDQNPDTRGYVPRISKLVCRDVEIEGVHYSAKPKLAQYDALILSGSRLSMSYFATMSPGTSGKGNMKSREVHIGRSELYGPVVGIARQLQRYHGDVLGICFGAQLLAYIHGGTIGRMQGDETGYLPHTRTRQAKHDAVFGHLPKTFLGSQHHRDYVAELPHGSTTLATRDMPTGKMIHAFRLAHEKRVLYGVQPHPEMSNPRDATLLTRVNGKNTTLSIVEWHRAKQMPPHAEYTLQTVITKFSRLVREKHL